MERYSVPKNYRVIESNGLLGLVKVAKDGFEKTVLESINKICVPAKSYGKIYIAYMPVGEEQSIILCNYNGKEVCKLPVFNIRLGAGCIYIRTAHPSTKELAWCLLDKDLKAIKYLEDFKITDKYCGTGYYIPVGQGYIEVTNTEGRRYYLELGNGNMEEIITVTPNEKKAAIEIKPTKYDIMIDIRKDMVWAIPDLGEYINITRLNDITKYVKLFALILGAPVMKIQQGKDIDAEYKFKDVPVDVADKFFKLLRRFENMGDISALQYIYKHIQNKFRDTNTGYNMLTELNKELHLGFKVITREKDGNYEIKCYIVEDNIIVLVQNKNGRLVSVVHNIINSKLFDDNDRLLINGVYNITGKKSIELIIHEIYLNSMQCNEEQTCKLPRPYSVLHRSEINSGIKNTYYERLNQVELDLHIPIKDGSFEEISFNIGICDGFCYVPKVRRYTKTVVDKGRTNNILVLLG